MLTSEDERTAQALADALNIIITAHVHLEMDRVFEAKKTLETFLMSLSGGR